MSFRERDLMKKVLLAIILFMVCVSACGCSYVLVQTNEQVWIDAN